MIWVVIFIAFILRIINLNQGLWLDETTQAILSQGSIYSIIFKRGVDFHPPLSYLLMHFWIQFGTSDVWLRILSVIFGIFTIWILYRFTKEVFNQNIAILAALFLAINPYHVYYSQEVRMYSEAAFFATVSIYFLYLLLKKDKFIFSIGYILSTTALLYTHYDGFFLIFAQILYVLIFEKLKIKKIFLNLLGVFLFLIPWISEFIKQLNNGLRANEYLPGWKDVLSIPFYKALPLTFLKFSFGIINFDNKLFYFLLAILILAPTFFVLAKSFKKTYNKNYYLPFFWLFIPILTALIFSLRIPLNQPFRLLFVLPAFSILLALGISNLDKMKNLFAVLLVVISFFSLTLYYLNPTFWREDWRGASDFVASKLNRDSVVLFAWSQPFPPYIWYANSRQGLGVVTKFPAQRKEVLEKVGRLEELKDIFIFEYLQPLSDPQKIVQKVIEEKGFRQKETYNFKGVGFIDYYVK